MTQIQIHGKNKTGITIDEYYEFYACRGGEIGCPERWAFPVRMHNQSRTHVVQPIVL